MDTSSTGRVISICFFQGKFEFLSNFYVAPLLVDDLTYATLEHAFQAAKTYSDSEGECVRNAPTPGEA